MDFKSGQEKVKAGKKVIDSSARCITCTKTCSMSGLCMKHWPEFSVPKSNGGKNGGKDIEKSS